ncbi:hypothetical protein [uncultured Methylobacterium sp.]|jgi:hypothetical protein|uniref:hypothetical protein n=1 Tax=uncultured Methylobacterium sp. TaxID=157278 RepID=UPI00262C9000|nr:hypothetical protein [uncultured Methylobacterium sp.]
MDSSKKLLTRQQVRERTGWSFYFIDQHLPRVRLGHRKIWIPLDAVEQQLTRQAAAQLGKPTHTLLKCEATRRLLGDIFQINEGSPHQCGSQGWYKFGEFLIDAFHIYMKEAEIEHEINTLDDVVAWQKAPQGREFFDKHIPLKYRPGLIVITSGEKTAGSA